MRFVLICECTLLRGSILSVLRVTTVQEVPPKPYIDFRLLLVTEVLYPSLLELW